MFVLCTPDQSEAMHEELRRIEEELFSELGLHFRVCAATSAWGSGHVCVERFGRRSCASPWFRIATAFQRCTLCQPGRASCSSDAP